MKTKSRILVAVCAIIAGLYFLPSITSKVDRIYVPTVVLDKFEKPEFNDKIKDKSSKIDTDSLFDGVDSGNAISSIKVDSNPGPLTPTDPPAKIPSTLNTLRLTPACSDKTLASEFKDFTSSKTSFWSSLTSDMILKYQSEWQDYLSNLDLSKYLVFTPETRGIIIASSPGLFQKTIKLLKLLKHVNCTLPIEIWHHSELEPSHITLLEKQGVSVHNLNSTKKYTLDGGKFFQIKIEAIIQSKLDSILFLDTDNFPIKNPTFLFDSLEFEGGAIFWKDYWKTHPTNPIWKVLDLDCVDEFEQESGQIMIRKSTPGIDKALALTGYMQDHADLYFKLLLGDKDTFRFAFRATQQAFHMINQNVRPIGASEGDFRGHSMAQSSPDGQIIFVHFNLLKYFDKNDFKAKRVILCGNYRFLLGFRMVV